MPDPTGYYVSTPGLPDSYVELEVNAPPDDSDEVVVVRLQLAVYQALELAQQLQVAARKVHCAQPKVGRHG